MEEQIAMEFRPWGAIFLSFRPVWYTYAYTYVYMLPWCTSYRHGIPSIMYRAVFHNRDWGFTIHHAASEQIFWIVYFSWTCPRLLITVSNICLGNWLFPMSMPEEKRKAFLMALRTSELVPSFLTAELGEWGLWQKEQWPPSSRDLNSWDYFLRGVVEGDANRTHRPTSSQLQGAIISSMVSLDRGIVAKACKGFRRRLEGVVGKEGN